MQELLDEIFCIPGVIGSCVFEKSQGILHRNPEEGLARDIQEGVGTHFNRLLQMSVKSNLNVKTAQFRFDKYWLVGIPLQEEFVLFVLCDLEANCSLIASAALLLVEEMSDCQPQTVLKGYGETHQSDEDVPGSELDEYFEDIEKALANAIGPVAKVVMNDSVSRWKKEGPPALPRLQELLDMLTDEIGDANLIAEFKSLLGHLY